MRQKFKSSLKPTLGFTLVEMVVVIAVLAIIGGISGVFVTHAIQGYANSERYMGLVDMSDNALKRMKREIRNAVPNSVRISSNGRVLEFIPIVFGGRYRVGLDENGGGDPLNFGTADNSFDVLGPKVPTVKTGDGLVIYNLGIAGANAYAGDNYRLLQNTGSNLSNLEFTGDPFTFGAPSRRFFMVSKAMVFICDLTLGQLWLVDDYPIVASLPANIDSIGSASKHLLADHVTTCHFRFDNGIQRRNSMLSLSLTLNRRPAVVRFYNAIDLVNAV